MLKSVLLKDTLCINIRYIIFLFCIQGYIVGYVSKKIMT